jgi:ArsR family transcriptional regulator
MHKQEIAELAALLKALSHPIRLQILCLLQVKEMTVGEIRQDVKTTDANISQHLTVLRNQKIVGFRKEANFIYNRIIDDRVIKLIETMQNLFCSIKE